jgi:hypothetical protein
VDIATPERGHPPSQEPGAVRAARRLAVSLGPAVPMGGVPEGLEARSVQQVTVAGDGWRVVPDRRRRLRLREVALVAAPVIPSEDPDQLGPAPAGAEYEPDLAVLGLAEPDLAFVLSVGKRSWTAVETRLRDRAWPVALALARAGMLSVRCDVTEALTLGSPLGWVLTERGALLGAQRAARVLVARGAQDARRQQVLKRLAAASSAEDPPLPVTADALRSLLAALEGGTGSARVPVLLAAAEDLLDRVRHDGPRAFSLAHFEHSKARDDVALILADAGVDAEVVAALGLRRSPRVGVAGPVDAEIGGQLIRLSLLDGPVLLRADQQGLRLVTSATHLVIVENLQAAEALEARGGLGAAVLYCAGVPSASTLGHVSALSSEVTDVLLCPDADLGGVRIAESLTSAMAAWSARVAVCDPGDWPHRPQARWPADGYTVRGLREHVAGPAGALARACLARRYRVEQEATVRAAVEHWLATGRAAPLT